jgi:DNA-binding response OmpR family regulator
MKILVMDDDQSMIDIYRVWLKSIDVEIDTCDNSYKASDKIMTGKIKDYDLLIADLNLEGSKGGDSVVALLREMELGQKEKTPVLILSGFINDEIKNKFKKKKEIYFLDKKSLDSDTFRSEVLKIVESMKK